MYFDQLQVLWVGKLLYIPGQKMENHFHSFFHMLCVFGGRGHLLIKNSNYLLREGQLFIIPPYCEHEFHSDKTEPLETIEVKFNLSVESPLSDIANIGRDSNVNIPEIKSLLEDAIHEASSKDYLYLEKIKTDIYIVLLRIIRQYLDTKPKSGTFSPDFIPDCNYKGVDFKKVIHYMESNLNKNITLNDLAKIGGFSPSYFCKVFRDKFSVTPKHFINSLRLKKAKELLMFTEMNISQIAVLVGFQSIHYFSRYFKEKENMSPLEYKEKMQKNVLCDFKITSKLGGEIPSRQQSV